MSALADWAATIRSATSSCWSATARITSGLTWIRSFISCAPSD
jgi:hypothetical protein